MILLLAFTKYIVRLSSITPRAIGAAILILGFIGTYTQKLRMSDALFTLVFAIVGRFMLKNGVPAFPMVVGLVLGPMLELRLKQSMSLSQGDAAVFLTRPLAATFLAFALIAVGIFTAAWRHLSRHAKPKSQTLGPFLTACVTDRRPNLGRRSFSPTFGKRQ